MIFCLASWILKGSMEGKHSVITCTLTKKTQQISTHMLINCGATGIEFLDEYFACNHDIPLQELKEKQQVKALDGRLIEWGDITHIAKVGMMIQSDTEEFRMFVTKSGH